MYNVSPSSMSEHLILPQTLDTWFIGQIKNFGAGSTTKCFEISGNIDLRHWRYFF